MMNLENLKKTELNKYPYPNAFVKNFIPLEMMEELRKTFPKENFRYYTRKNGVDDYYTKRGFKEKVYKMCGRHLVKAGEEKPDKTDDLTPLWLELCEKFLSREYKEAMSDLTGVNLNNCAVEIDLWNYHPGCFTGPHTDDPWKSASQILYFVKEWKEEWGGMGRMHDFKKENHIVSETIPSMTVSPIFIRSDISYHSISVIKPTVPEARKVVDVVFYNTLPLPKRPGMVIGEVLDPSAFID